MGLRVEAPFQLRSNARLADAGFARNYHDLAVARGRAPSGAIEGRSPRRDRLAESAPILATQYLPSRHRRGDALDVDGTEVAVLEKSAEQPARACADHDRLRLGQGL